MAAEYRLARRALLDLREIQTYTARTWSEAQAERYLDQIYAGLQRLAANPDRDTSRFGRSAPFRMVAAQEHFIIFDVVGGTLVVLSIMNQAQNIERRIARLSREFCAEIAAFRG